ncbi:MAG: hypothetical protein ACXVQR_07640, partial [Solirubrobacteraceae bacterium]
SSIADAQHLGLPLWIGEFGSGPADTNTVLSAHFAQQDAFGLSSALWLWKENANDIDANAFWGVYGPPFGPGVPQRDRIRLTSRVYPLLTAGDLRGLSYDPASGRFAMRASSRRIPLGSVARATVVFIPATVHGGVHVHDARVVVVRRSAGGRLVYVFPSGGTYTVSVS